jgi:hypothetical protein
MICLGRIGFTYDTLIERQGNAHADKISAKYVQHARKKDESAPSKARKTKSLWPTTTKPAGVPGSLCRLPARPLAHWFSAALSSVRLGRRSRLHLSAPERRRERVCERVREPQGRRA